MSDAAPDASGRIVNFFGHAVVATEVEPRPVVVLGAMLPDLEAMVDSTASRLTNEDLAQGVRLHHVTDGAFHGGGSFLHHQERARAELSATPIRRGPRRAVAHVGVELILDAALRTPTRLEAYVAALESGRGARTLHGAPVLHRLKLRALFETLIRRSPYVTPTSPSGVVERLQRALWSRPVLRLNDAELPYVEAWAERAWQPIRECAEEWLASLTAAVRAATGASPAANDAASK